MKKIDTLFERSGKEGGYLVIPKLTPGCEWVLEGKGIITIKIDGMNVKVDNGQLYKRQKSKDPLSEASYVPVTNLPEDAMLMEAFKNTTNAHFVPDGIYEAYGPKINGNPQGAEQMFMVKTIPADGSLMLFAGQTLIKRGPGVDVQELFDSLKDELEDSEIEGFVFQLEQVSFKPVAFAKIKRKDYGLSWPIPQVKVTVVETNELPPMPAANELTDPYWGAKVEHQLTKIEQAALLLKGD